ncbi:NAD(P)-binding protein [Mycena galericulata]|nr:NAD(P)-binding protein [Mycena galericulata]
MASVYGMVRRVYTVNGEPTHVPTANPLNSEYSAQRRSRLTRFSLRRKAIPRRLSMPLQPETEIGQINSQKAWDSEGVHKLPRFAAAKCFLNRRLSLVIEMLEDSEINAIYNPLPAGLHYEWTMKALTAGKHVLVENPSSYTAEETRRMFELAETKGLVLLEALHNQYAMLNFMLTIRDKGYLKPDDIRFNYELGGGALMDMGCTDPTEVLSVEHELKAPKVDRNTTAKLALPGGATTATLACRTTSVMDAVIECESGRIEVKNYIMPTLYHSITVTPTGGKKRVEKAYTFPNLGQPWWTTYRYQLEAFVNKVKGRKTHAWITKEYSVKNMEIIESIYAKSGLGSRPKSNFVPPQW